MFFQRVSDFLIFNTTVCSLKSEQIWLRSYTVVTGLVSCGASQVPARSVPLDFYQFHSSRTVPVHSRNLSISSPRRSYQTHEDWQNKKQVVPLLFSINANSIMYKALTFSDFRSGLLVIIIRDLQHKLFLDRKRISLEFSIDTNVKHFLITYHFGYQCFLDFVTTLVVSILWT